MRVFKDTENRSWTITINIGAIKRVRDLCKIDLLKIVEDNMKLLQDLTNDPVLLVDVLYVVCKPEADAKQITDEMFGQSMSGDSIWEGFNALVDDLISFFPDPRQRAILQKMMVKIRAAAGMLMDQGEKMVDQIDPSEVLKTLTISSGNSPESQASTPTP